MVEKDRHWRYSAPPPLPAHRDFCNYKCYRYVKEQIEDSSSPSNRDVRIANPCVSGCVERRLLCMCYCFPILPQLQLWTSGCVFGPMNWAKAFFSVTHYSCCPCFHQSTIESTYQIDEQGLTYVFPTIHAHSRFGKNAIAGSRNNDIGRELAKRTMRKIPVSVCMRWCVMIDWLSCDWDRSRYLFSFSK